MAVPSLPSIHQPLDTPAAEWAQQTVEAISPDASKDVVPDAHGNPTTDHPRSAFAGEPGHGVNADKTAGILEARKLALRPPIDENALEDNQDITPTETQPRTRPTPKLYTDAQGNPITNPDGSAIPDTPGVGSLPSAAASMVSTPGAQLPGGWIRGPESRQSVAVPETSLYEDVSAALGTVGQAAFSVLPASVVGSLSHNREQGGANPDVAPAQAPSPPADKPKASPPRSSSPGILSRAQGVLNGLLARPASPARKLPVPDAPTTTGAAALVGGGAVAKTANKIGDNVAAGQDLGGHDPKGVLEGDEQAKLEREAPPRAVPSQGANTAARFMDANVPTPDPTKPPSGVSDSLFPVMPDEGQKNKKGRNLGSTLSPDADVQEAASKFNQDFSAPIPSTASEDPKSPSSPSATRSQPTPANNGPQPTVTKVSDSGVKGIILDVKDVVAAPFAGSRAPVESNELGSPVTSEKDKMSTAPADQPAHLGANPDGIRTTVNPHTAHTNLPPPREEAGEEHVGGTGVLGSSAARENKQSGIKREGIKPTANKAEERENEEDEPRYNAGSVIVRGISSHGSGQGKVYASPDGRVSSRSAPDATSTAHDTSVGNGHTSPPGSPNKGVSRLWSRSRRSVDEGSSGVKPTRSRFSEQEPSTGSDSLSAPGSPSSSRFKVPLKDKIKGELKIISGKVSRNGSKVERGIALKTGQAHGIEPVSPTTQKH